MELRVMFEVPQAQFKEKDRVILPSGRPGRVVGPAVGLKGRLEVEYTDAEGGLVDIFPKYLQIDNRQEHEPIVVGKGMMLCQRCGNLFKRTGASSKYCSKRCYKDVSNELARKRRLMRGNWVEI